MHVFCNKSYILKDYNDNVTPKDKKIGIRNN